MQCTSRTPAFGGAFWGNRSLVGCLLLLFLDSGRGRGGGPVSRGAEHGVDHRARLSSHTLVYSQVPGTIRGASKPASKTSS